MRRSVVLATAVAVAGSTLGATAAHAQVTVPVTTTVVEGLLTLAGTGVAASVSASPGQVSEAVGATALTVSDLRGTDAGWSVTATYSDPTSEQLAAVTGSKALGGANVLLSSGNVTGDISGANLALVTDQALSAPVAVASTGTAGGSGVTEVTASFKTRVPATAKTVDVFLGTVTYTVASVR